MAKANIKEGEIIPTVETSNPASEAATQLLSLLENANPEIQKQIVQHLSERTGFVPGAIGQSAKPKRKRPNPSQIVAAFGSVVNDEDFAPGVPEGVRDSDGQVGRATSIFDEDNNVLRTEGDYFDGPKAKAWLKRWEEGSVYSSKKAAQVGEDFAQTAQMEYSTVLS